MSVDQLPIVFQADLVEEVVLRLIRHGAHEPAFRRERDRVYLSTDPDERECSFQRVHTEWFERLGLTEPIRTACAELPILAQTCARCMVTRAVTRPDEAADLLVAPTVGGAARTVVVRLRPSAFDDAEALLALLRAELLHVADMVDPDFGYQPELPPADGGPSHDQLLRERYRVLWDVSVAGRLVRRGVAAPEDRGASYRAFAAAFPMLGAASDTAFARFFDGTVRTHNEFVAFATLPRSAVDGLQPGGRCPLCRFPTYAPEPAPERLPAEVKARIARDFPSWRPSEGVCRQCADLYRARPLSMAAAEQLPAIASNGSVAE